MFTDEEVGGTSLSGETDLSSWNESDVCSSFSRKERLALRLGADISLSIGRGDSKDIYIL
jgi:hypothetical protein